MTLEGKIRFKAIGLYSITGIAAVVMLLFLYNMRNNIKNQKTEIEKQHRTLALMNELIYAIGEAQSSVSLFVATQDTGYIQEFQKKRAAIHPLIDSLAVTEPAGKGKLRQIKKLLAQQTENILKINRLLGNKNPVTLISERIQTYKPQHVFNSRSITIQQDTVYKAPERKKGLFRRLKEVFIPEKNNTMVVSNTRIDTIRVENPDAPPILSEVNKMALTAGKQYEQNIRAIGQQMANELTADREISTQIAGLVLALHSQTLHSMLATIGRSEQAINRNYTLSIIGGIIALVLILLFILLIIYDVNKGKEARERLRQVMESRHKLLLSVSHDIKSPLASILGHLELHRQQGEDVRSMQNSARHILALMDNLLEFSSLEQGSLQTTFSNFSLNALNEEIGQMFLPLAKAKGLTFTFRSDEIRIHSDLMKIKQIVINLVSNAIKYTREGAIDLQIHYANKQVLIEVMDTGAGIPGDKLEEIYEPFSRVESNNALAPGTGLGMYVVKGLIDLLGGSITVTSSVAKGTTVKVTIPCLPAKSPIRQGAKRIAVYDDDPLVKEMASEMLTRLGHHVVEKEYEIILTDMEMGELSGLDILAKAGSIPVIVMTGHSDFTPDKAIQLGFDGFLPKPFTLETVREIFGEGATADTRFLEDDDAEIRDMFRAATADNFGLLQQSLTEDDFDKAQAVCHKMLPMFVLLGYPAEELRRMDAQRGKLYAAWKNDVTAILSIKI